MPTALELLGEDHWEWRERAKADPAIVDLMRREFRTAWDEGDEETRVCVLTWLVAQPMEVGIGLVVAVLRGEQPTVEEHEHKSTAVICLMNYLRNGSVLLPRDVELLVAATSDWSISRAGRGLALMTLDDAKAEEFEATARAMAIHDPSALNRFDANLQLLRRGHTDVKPAMFEAVRQYDEGLWEDPTEAASSLWYYRDKLDFTPAEDAEVRSSMEKKLAKLRIRAREYDWWPGASSAYENNAAFTLLDRLREGFTPMDRDVDLLGAAAFLHGELASRLKAVEGIAWFANDRARYLLSELATWSDSQEVRAAASEQLEKLGGRDS